jgi:hypothetical protein
LFVPLDEGKSSKYKVQEVKAVETS